jgi:YgiT-type zinc finger domain-containing protein
MKCAICHFGQTKPGDATVTFERGSKVIVVKGIPGEVCDSCGEPYFTRDVTERLQARVDVAARSGAEVEVLYFAA